MKTLLCFDCAQSKPVAEFYKDRSSKRRYTRRCKQCNTKATKSWRKSDKSWKVQKECTECSTDFMPTNPTQTVCGISCRDKIGKRVARFNHPEKVKDYNGRRYKQKLRERFLEMYGRSCMCCGEDCVIFLTVDHKQNDGNLERKKLGGGEPYRTLRIAIEKYNPERYQVLCFNCNLGRNLNSGICPHKQ